MKILCAGCVIILVSSSQILAQTTSPLPVDLSYHFKPGTTLHYQRLDEMRNPDNPPGYQEGNFDTKDDIHITVEKVDAASNATLVIQNEEVNDFKGGDDAKGVTMGGLAQDIPLYRVTVDKYGKYISGKILRYSLQDSLLHEEMKDPRYHIEPRSDSSIINFWMDHVLCLKRPTRSGSRVGMKWDDTLCKLSHNTTYYYNQSASAPTQQQPSSPSYNSYHYDYSIAQDANARNEGKYTFGTETTFYQVDNGKILSEGLTDEKQDIRSSDGLTLTRTEFQKRVPGKSADTSFDHWYMTRTLTLISIDSTQK
jgi:hypothetical protein